MNRTGHPDRTAAGKLAVDNLNETRRFKSKDEKGFFIDQTIISIAAHVRHQS